LPNGRRDASSFGDFDAVVAGPLPDGHPDIEKLLATTEVTDAANETSDL